MDMPGLAYEILNWDGRSVADLDAIYQRYATIAASATDIILCINEPQLQKAATWLLKKHFENGGELRSDQVSNLYALLPKLEHWETKLHILQCLQYIPIPKSTIKSVETFIRECLGSDNKFVRAWAYNAFHLLAKQHHRHRDEMRTLFETAMVNESASVKARIRRITESR